MIKDVHVRTYVYKTKNFEDLILQGGAEKILMETIDSFVVNSNFCEAPCTLILYYFFDNMNSLQTTIYLRLFE